MSIPTLSFWFLNVGTAWQVILPTSLQMLTLVSTSPKLGASVETFITFSENFNQGLERMTFPQSAANIVYLCMYYSEGSCPVCIYVDWHVRACYVFVHVLGWVCCALHSVVLSHLTCFGFKDGNGYPMFSSFVFHDGGESWSWYDVGYRYARSNLSF